MRNRPLDRPFSFGRLLPKVHAPRFQRLLRFLAVLVIYPTLLGVNWLVSIVPVLRELSGLPSLSVQVVVRRRAALYLTEIL